MEIPPRESQADFESEKPEAKLDGVGGIFGAGASSARDEKRNWVPLGIAAGVVLAVALAALLLGERRRPDTTMAALTAATDPYAANLPMTGLAMSESSNLAGGKVTYLDGHIANHGGRTVTGITVQVLFRNYAHEVAQNQPMAMTVIRMRNPYIDTAPLSAVPLKPGGEEDFRLNFDSVSPDWAGEIPEIRILRVDSR